MAIVQIGEMITHLSNEFIADNEHIPWKRIKSLRNVIVHGYGDLELPKIWNIATNDVPVLLNDINKILSSTIQE